jgi:hypothetical protein
MLCLWEGDMGTNTVLFGWARSNPGREHLSASHFEEFVKYLNGRKEAKAIDDYEIVFLDAHGGDLGGFFLIKAESDKLDAFLSSGEWVMHMTRASMHLDNVGIIRGVTGVRVAERMALWSGLIPQVSE